MKQFILFSLIIFVSCVSVPKKEMILEESESESEPSLEVYNLTNRAFDSEKSEKSTLELTSPLLNKPLYKFSPQELDKYLAFLQKYEPDLQKRIQHLAKQAVGQPYEIYLLGEFPFEIYDTQPLYNLEKSDCVVFSEHIYAMALSDNWKKFFTMLQRIRYKDGIISILTRNHFTEADWVINNSWLIENITEKLPSVKFRKVKTIIDRAKFFSKWDLGQDIPIQELEWAYIPASEVSKAIKHLKTGDFVNVVRGFTPESVFVGHVGIISVEEDGTVNLIHSTTPEVKIESLIDYMNNSLSLNKRREKENKKILKENIIISRYNDSLRTINNGIPHPDEKSLIPFKPYFYGFSFFRLRENALDNLRAIDGDKAPRVVVYGEN